MKLKDIEDGASYDKLFTTKESTPLLHLTNELRTLSNDELTEEEMELHSKIVELSTMKQLIHVIRMKSVSDYLTKYLATLDNFVLACIQARENGSML